MMKKWAARLSDAHDRPTRASPLLTRGLLTQTPVEKTDEDSQPPEHDPVDIARKRSAACRAAASSKREDILSRRERRQVGFYRSYRKDRPPATVRWSERFS